MFFLPHLPNIKGKINPNNNHTSRVALMHDSSVFDWKFDNIK